MRFCRYLKELRLGFLSEAIILVTELSNVHGEVTAMRKFYTWFEMLIR
jgi:hypothetical protein